MLKSIASLLDNKKTKVEEQDVGYFVGDYLKKRLKNGGVYCEKVGSGKAWVVVPGATLQQEILMIENELKAAVKNELNYKLVRIVVRAKY